MDNTSPAVNNDSSSIDEPSSSPDGPPLAAPKTRRARKKPSREAVGVKLYRAKLMLTNAAIEPVAAAVAAFGYGPERLAEGQALFNTAQALEVEQDVRLGQQKAATQALDTAWATARTAYIRHLTLARLALGQDPEAVRALALSGPRAQAFMPWFGQASQFYDNLLAQPAYQAQLAHYGQTHADLTHARALVLAAQTAQQAQATARGAAQKATQARTAALNALEAWLGAFRRVARLALTGSRAQLLETLGIVVPS